MIRPVSPLAPNTRPSPRPVRPEAPALRQQVAYTCIRGHAFTVTFAAEAELPQAWSCRCGSPGRTSGSPSAALCADDGRDGHRKAVLKRRSPVERDRALTERLAEVAAMRKAIGSVKNLTSERNPP